MHEDALNVVQDPPPVPDGQTFYDTSIAFMRQFMESMSPRFENWRAELGLPKRTLDEQVGTMLCSIHTPAARARVQLG